MSTILPVEFFLIIRLRGPSLRGEISIPQLYQIDVQVNTICHRKVYALMRVLTLFLQRSVLPKVSIETIIIIIIKIRRCTKRKNIYIILIFSLRCSEAKIFKNHTHYASDCVDGLSLALTSTLQARRHLKHETKKC